MEKIICKNNCKGKDENCLELDSNGFPLQCVGPWVEDKYFSLEQYLHASREARKMFSDNGNAVFIDLFAGPGRCIIRGDRKEIDSGGIRALNLDEAPFNEYFYFDISKTNTDALKKRIGDKPNCHVKCGDSNLLVKEFVKDLLHKEGLIRRYRYHFAYIDPFGPDDLKFNTLRELAKLNRMDMLINFPIGPIKRNLSKWKKNKDTILDDLLGTSEWRKAITGISADGTFAVLTNIFKAQLKSIGYPEEGVKMKNIYAGLPAISVKNTKKVDLYLLILASKHPVGRKIWNSIIKARRDGQKAWF